MEKEMTCLTCAILPRPENGLHDIECSVQINCKPPSSFLAGPESFQRVPGNAVTPFLNEVATLRDDQRFWASANDLLQGLHLVEAQHRIGYANGHEAFARPFRQTSSGKRRTPAL
jgi:hypothetical protein